jgi:glutathione S-transferase
MKLYGNDLSPFAQMAELLLETKGIAYSRVLPTREFVRDEGFDEINPLRKIPVLVLDDEVVPETHVISELIDELYPAPALLPEGPTERARVRLLCRTADLYVATPVIQLLNNEWGARSQDIAASALGMIERGMRGLERWIGAGPYALGESRSLADCALPPALFCMKEVSPRFGVGGLPAFGPKVESYYQAIQRDQHVARCFSRMASGLEQHVGPTSRSA